MQDRSAAIQGLASLKDKYDDFLGKINSNKALYEHKNFVLKLLMYPVLSWKDMIALGDGFSKVFTFLSSPVPLALGVAGVFGIDMLPAQWGTSILTVNTEVLKWIAPVLGYLVSLGANLIRMITVSDPKFHIEAYKTFRKEEWELFFAYLDASPFTFNHLYDQVEKIDYRLDEQARIIEERFENQKTQYETIIRELKEKLKRYKEKYSLLSAEYQAALEDSEAELDIFTREIKHVVDLISAASTTLERLCNGQFSTIDLAVISDYSLYERRGNELVLIDNKGLTNAKKRILIDDHRYRHWSMVRAVKLKEDKPFEGWSKRGRKIISRRFIMPDNKVWIYNFHINPSDERALSLTSNDIMMTREVYRLVYAICIHLHRQGISKEVV
ncbi:hypothetical protein AM501_24105 [Aneurinibacillus migulanus]|uniref:hypothetical protein n=1 Tax=Aneurinibacillus migulanus TaxID=47500 RepID=UPI0005BA6F64|nr:hypothetical protein [Aneurinibacillus migulanus]KIV58909.1 hypothetical protein TS64_03875 [Aneurinibacillus migulanus]KPD05859.1 hypothetical protein AM501_24105 [Aneurinibacillus migulanus]